MEPDSASRADRASPPAGGRALNVVLNLDFWSGVPGGARLLRSRGTSARVPLGGDLVLQEQLKVIELLGRDDVACPLSARVRAPSATFQPSLILSFL